MLSFSLLLTIEGSKRVLFVPFGNYGDTGCAAAIMEGPRLATLPKGEFGTYHEQPGHKVQKYRVIMGYSSPMLDK